MSNKRQTPRRFALGTLVHHPEYGLGIVRAAEAGHHYFAWVSGGMGWESRAVAVEHGPEAPPRRADHLYGWCAPAGAVRCPMDTRRVHGPEPRRAVPERQLRGRAPVVGFVRDVMPGERFAPVGAVVLGSYWRTRYRVLAHVAHSDWRGESVRVVDLDGWQAGRVREHSTRLDGRDVLLSIPTDTGRVHGPHLPTSRYLCAHGMVSLTAHDAYVGPFVTRSDLRAGPDHPAYAPTPADLEARP